MNDVNDKCGTKHFPKRLRRILSIHYNQACIIHDDDYRLRRISRKQADIDFLNHMLIDSKDKFWLKVEAYIFYYAVRWFGWIFY